MPLLFLAIGVLSVVAMATAGATSKTPPILAPPNSPTVSMQPGEIWLVAGKLDLSNAQDTSDDAWETFHTNLVTIMEKLGARIGKLMHSGETFAFQIQPTTQVVTLAVPSVDPPFTITKAEKVQGATQISGFRFRRVA